MRSWTDGSPGDVVEVPPREPKDNAEAWRYALRMVNRDGHNIFKECADVRRRDAVRELIPRGKRSIRAMVIGHFPEAVQVLAERGDDWVALTPTELPMGLREAKHASGHSRTRRCTEEEAGRVADGRWGGRVHLIVAAATVSPAVLRACGAADRVIVAVEDVTRPKAELMAAAGAGHRVFKICKPSTSDATKPSAFAVCEGRGDADAAWPARAVALCETRRASKLAAADDLYAYFDGIGLTTRTACQEHYTTARRPEE